MNGSCLIHVTASIIPPVTQAVFQGGVGQAATRGVVKKPVGIAVTVRWPVTNPNGVRTGLSRDATNEGDIHVAGTRAVIQTGGCRRAHFGNDGALLEATNPLNQFVFPGNLAGVIAVPRIN